MKFPPKNYYNSLQHVISFQTQKTPWHPWPERAKEAYQHQNATKNGRVRFSECRIPMLWVSRVQKMGSAT